MSTQRLANPKNLPQLEASFPSSLDTDLQISDWDRFTDPRLFERILKLHGLLSPHLVISEAQVLDHLALRYFLLNLNASERDEFISYALTPLTVEGFSNLGPIILASEAYEATDLTRPFPLKDLLRRKLSLDEWKKPCWEFSSIDQEHRSDFNKNIARLDGFKRFQFVVDNLGPTRSYKEYLTHASHIWDRNASITRIPTQMDLPLSLQQHLDKALQSQVNAKVREVAGKLRRQIAAAEITYADGTSKGAVIRSTVRPWLRETLGPRKESPEADFFDDLLNRAWYEAFVVSLPRHRGWIGRCDPTFSESYGELNAPPNVRRRPIADTTAQVIIDTFEVTTAGPLILDRLDFGELKKLRANEKFQRSLLNLHQEWWCQNPYNNGLKSALKNHFNLIYRLLGAHLRSSQLRENGSNLRGTIFLPVSTAVLMALDKAVAGSNPYCWLGLSLQVVLLNVWTWERNRKKPERLLHDVEERVFREAERGRLARVKGTVKT